jgi:release factor glutamine methyltransferase
VSRREWAELEPEVTEYEPRRALDGGAKGLDQVRVLIRQAPAHMKAGGWLIFEIGCDQWEDVKNLLEETDRYQDFDVVKDYNGRDRVVRTQLKASHF